jgi:hypothetical protein
MYTLNSWKNIEIVLDASGIDESSKWFLVQDIPQYNGGVKLVDWHGLEKNNSVVSFVNGDKIEKTLHIRYFTNELFPSSLYVSLYDDSGKIFAPSCLIIWNRKRPHVTNHGYAPGRCPEFLESKMYEK